MRFVLGVDGGSSKTHALVADETGRALGFGRGGTGNHQVNGLQPALQELSRAIESASQQANLSPSEIELGYFCLAGADLPEDYAMLQAAVKNLNLVQSVIVKNDTMAALRSGTRRSWGVVVICGTGFNAAGRSPEGREIVLPGLGPISGDWGGGYALSQEMIRHVMRAWDGRGQATLLTGLVLEALAVDSVDELLSELYHERIDSRVLLDLVPHLFEAAHAGDAVAQDLVVRMGREVAVTANALIRRLGLNQCDVEVVLGGSVFKGKGNLLFDTITHLVHQNAPQAKIVMPRYEPVVGAALLALECIGVEVNETHYQTLEASLASTGRSLLQDHWETNQ